MKQLSLSLSLDLINQKLLIPSLLERSVLFLKKARARLVRARGSAVLPRSRALPTEERVRRIADSLVVRHRFCFTSFLEQ